MHPILERAFEEYSVNGNMDRVIDYWKSIADWARRNNYPWCGAFANFILEETGYNSPNSPNPQDFKNIGTALTAPEPGCIAVTSGNPGHVTFVLKVLTVVPGLSPSVLVLGGNQDNEVKVWRRAMSNFVSWRRPEPI